MKDIVIKAPPKQIEAPITQLCRFHIDRFGNEHANFTGKYVHAESMAKLERELIELKFMKVILEAELSELRAKVPKEVVEVHVGACPQGGTPHAYVDNTCVKCGFIHL